MRWLRPPQGQEVRRFGELYRRTIEVDEQTESQIAESDTPSAADICAVKRGTRQAETSITGSIALNDDLISSAPKLVQTPILIAIRHQSIEQIPEQALLASLPDEYRQYCVIERVVDQCDLFQASRLTDPLEAARRQVNLEASVTELLTKHPQAPVAYYGSAHIPLAFLAGFRLSNRRRIVLFDFDRHRRTWNQLQHHRDAPPLTLSGLPSRVRRARGDVVVRVSISHCVMPEVVAEVVPSPIASIHLGLEQAQIDMVTSEPQVWAYSQAFRQTMDRIHTVLPGATGIHVFYAGPPSLAFYCAQQVSKTIHPRIIIYNYCGKDVPKYSWGLDITKDVGAEGFVVRPAAC